MESETNKTSSWIQIGGLQRWGMGKMGEGGQIYKLPAIR